ncbi:hypothetical protein Tco_0737206 [Tanacetum coccineum]
MEDDLVSKYHKPILPPSKQLTSKTKSPMLTITKVDSLEKELKQTKLTMGKAIVKLMKKVKKMEAVLKRRHVVLTDSDDKDAENSSKQGRCWKHKKCRSLPKL